MWFFYSPGIIYGEDAIDFLENIPGEKVFIVTDKVLEELGILKILTEKLDQFGKKYMVFNDVQPDPHEDDVLTARQQCIDYAPDLVMALGGGSVMDTAKVVWGLYEFPELILDDLHPFNGELYKLRNKSKLVAITTTSGTGAEITNISVISRFIDGIWKKHFFLHKSLMPSYAIVDPIFAVEMPPKLTVDTAFDALSHSLEGITSLWKNEFSYAMALKAIELIFKYLPIVAKDGKNMEARDYMHQAATMAGLAFGNSQAQLAHTLGHSWGSVFHVPHGRAVGIFLPYVLQYCLNNPDEADKTEDLLGKVAKQLGWANWDEDNKKSANIVIKKVKELQKKVGFSFNLKELGTTKEDYDKNIVALVNLCFEDSSSVLGPRSANSEEFRKLYEYAFEGKDVDF
ncbi:MAG: iron-containing alcohol dehydrogenase [Promethearchaeota archaeon]